MFTQNGGVYYDSANDNPAFDANGKGAFGGEPLHRHPTAPSSTHLSESARLSVTWDGQKGLDDSPMERHRATPNAPANDPNKKAPAKELYGSDPDDVSSKWIHRDKLARIENEELQAAGIILPKSRARSRPRRDVSVDRANGHRADGHRTAAAENDGIPTEARSRRSSIFSERKAPDAAATSWDLRLPGEIDSEAYFVPATGTKNLSRIPVAKLSPAPIPLEHIERDSMLARKRGNSLGAEDSIAFLQSRSRSNSGKMGDGSTVASQRNASRSISDLSPKKPAANSSVRKSSPSKANSNGRPRTRGGLGKEANGSAAGGSTARSGERELSPGASSKRPEGEPPWMISAYRPDPRLPPDQQLLPTVARRLQQERWEREGKFGNIYDKEFRPLTENGFLTPPEASDSTSAAAPTAATTGDPDSWPLKLEAKAPSPPNVRPGSYSTIPKIQDKQGLSPLPSPLGPATEAPPEARPVHTTTVMATATATQEDDAQGGCGCCVVM